MFIIHDNKVILAKQTTTTLKQRRQYGKIGAVKALKLVMTWRSPLNLMSNEVKRETNPWELVNTFNGLTPRFKQHQVQN